jgi:hypothetical protein
VPRVNVLIPQTAFQKTFPSVVIVVVIVNSLIYSTMFS